MATTSNDACGRNSTYQADSSATNTNTLTTSTTTTTTKTMNTDREANRRLAKRRSLGRDIVRIHQLTDLTDKPIRMAKGDICRSRVRATGSNCICCCYNSSIALVTTNDSYIIDHIPLDDIQSAQANSSLQYLALSNKHQIAIIDLVENQFSLSSKNSSLSSCSSASSQQSSCTSTSSTSSTSASTTTTTRSKYTLSSAPASSLTILSGTNKPRNGAKVVNLAGKGLKMDDVRYWRWLDESVLALLTHEALFVCPIDQTQFNHPALTALSRSPQLLSIEKVCDIHANLTGKFCQITDIQRDTSTNLYAISGLCRSSDLYQANYSLSVTQQQASSQLASTTASNSNYYRLPSFNSSTLKHSFSSVPSRLSQLVNNERSFDSIKSDSLSMAADIPLSRSIDQSQPPPPPPPSSSLNVPLKEGDDDSCQVCGLVQIYCKLRDRSQLIQVHAVTFAACPMSVQLTSNDIQKDTGVACNESKLSEQLTAVTTTTTLVAANRIDDKLRVHFIGMATSEDLTSNGQSASPLTKFHSFDNKFDYPVSIVCSTIDGNAKLHVAMIATKYGQLYVCSVLYGTILFDVRASYDVISSTVVDSTTTGLMAVCRNGQVLLVRLDGQRLGQLLDESRSLRPIASFNHLNSTDYFTESNKEFKQNSHDNSSDAQQDIGSNVLISTRL